MGDSVATENLFQKGIDDIIFEGELMKFKPGISANFMPRYVQISRRAFRYFKNLQMVIEEKPIVSFRKTIIESAEPYHINKGSYLKKGSRITEAGTEDKLFDSCFEIKLNENYEDNYIYRDVERAVRTATKRREFHKKASISKKAIRD